MGRNGHILDHARGWYLLVVFLQHIVACLVKTEFAPLVGVQVEVAVKDL